MSDGILIVCGQRSFGEFMADLLSEIIPGPHVIAVSGAEARRRTSQSEFPAVLIADRLPDESATFLAYDLAEKGCAGVMVIIDRNALQDAHEALDGTGATILLKPLSKEALRQSVKLVMRLTEGGGTLDRAKLMLMQMKNCSEPQAHRYIQKLSMDRRIPREMAAQLIIKALKKEAEGAGKQ